MKKALLFLLTLAATTTILAQNVTPAGEGSRITEFEVTYSIENTRALQNGETQIYKVGEFEPGILTDCNPQKVDNPAKDNVNGNDQCLELTCGADGYDLFKMYLPWNDSSNNRFNLYGRRRLSLLYKPGDGSTDFNVNLELIKQDDSTSPATIIYQLKLGAWYDAGGGWKRLYFNFEPYEETNPSHPVAIDDFPNILVFDAKTKTGEDYHDVAFSEGAKFYIDDIKVEAEPYADGIWIDHWGNRDERWRGTYDASTAHQEYPQNETSGAIYLSGTWLKGENIVNPDILVQETGDGRVHRWVYIYNEYRDLSWHIKPDKVKYIVFQKGSKLRMPDHGALIGKSTEQEQKSVADGGYAYPARFVPNRNILIFAEDTKETSGIWYDTNVAFYNGESWEARDLEMADDYNFVNPIPFTVKEKIMVNRSMTEGFNTIIYPFSLTAEEIRSSRVGTFYHHNADDIVYFIPTDATEANVPFVTENFSPLFEEGGINVTKVFQQFDGERTISACSDTEEYRQLSANQKGLDYHSWSLDDANYNLVGTYHRISGEGKWGIATTGTYGNSDYQQTFKKGGSLSSFKPFRAYLDIPESQGAAKFAALSIADFTDDSTITGISQDVVALPSGRQDVYTLSGIRIKAAATAEELINLPKGVYIINGKKQFVR